MLIRDPELDELIAMVRANRPGSPSDVRKILDHYYQHVIAWSLLKDEYVHHLSKKGKDQLCEKIYKEIKIG